MDYARLLKVADAARGRGRLAAGDVGFICETVPAELADFPKLALPKSVKHPGGFTVSGAPVGTFARSALMLAAQKALGRRFGGDAFYERVESEFAMRIMRSHFHGEAPKGAFCCKQCTLAVLPVLEADAIRWFDGKALAKAVRRLIDERAWRFNTAPNAAMLAWALG